MKSGNKKGGESVFSKPQILRFNLLIINHLIFLLTVILDNSDFLLTIILDNSGKISVVAMKSRDKTKRGVPFQTIKI